MEGMEEWTVGGHHKDAKPGSVFLGVEDSLEGGQILEVGVTSMCNGGSGIEYVPWYANKGDIGVTG